MSSKRFNKGDLVTVFDNWDSNGTIRTRDMMVYSCGAKRMVLVNDDGLDFAKREFRLVDINLWAGGSYVLPRTAPEATRVTALALGEAYLSWRREEIAKHLAHYGANASPGYRAALAQDLADMHEPRALRVEG